MKSIKPILVLIIIVCIVTVIIPAILAIPSLEDKSGGALSESGESTKQTGLDISRLDQSDLEVTVYRTANKKVETLPLEKYIAGVVASEMPTTFELEALKAQALTARTYIVHHMLKGEKAGLPSGAQVDDTVKYQVFKNDAELRAQWGKNYQDNMNKIAQAVLETEGQILTYDGTPITATFFSNGNGYTEAAEALWKNAYPYLKSVASPWDEQAPEFEEKISISLLNFENKLGVKLKNTEKVGTIVERTPGKRVAKVDINGKQFTGMQIRELLNLRSTDFNWVLKGDAVIITTKGYGHGVGMSQWGANGMAREGKSYEEIVKHYYQGIEIASADTLTQQIVANK